MSKNILVWALLCISLLFGCTAPTQSSDDVVQKPAQVEKPDEIITVKGVPFMVRSEEPQFESLKFIRVYMNGADGKIQAFVTPGAYRFNELGLIMKDLLEYAVSNKIEIEIKAKIVDGNYFIIKELRIKGIISYWN